MRRLRRQRRPQVLRGRSTDDDRAPQERGRRRQAHCESVWSPRLLGLRRGAPARRQRHQHHRAWQVVCTRAQERGEGGRARRREETRRAYQRAARRVHQDRSQGVKRPFVYMAGVGRCSPERVLKNHEFAAMGIDTNDEWIVQRTGIRERHIAGPDENNRTMSAAASKIAMERAGVHPGEIDLIVLGTASPDHLLPSTAVELQAELGASRAAAFDISAACSSWLYGLIVAEGLMMSGNADTALVVGTEKLSAIVDWKDRSTAVLF